MTTAGQVRLLGLRIDRVSEAQTIATVLSGLEQGHGGVVVTPNLDQLRQLSHRPQLVEIFDAADLVVADGMPLVWASRLQGSPLPERVAGSDLVWSLTAEAALRGRSIFLLGGAPGACEAAEAKLRRVYPGALIAGHLCPPVGFEHDAAEIGRVTDALRKAGPDIVYVALGFPKQERLIAYLRTEFPRTWFLGVGFSLSFVAGQVPRAPDWMIRLGLEWVHRLVHEPRRLARRYLVQGLPFGLRLFSASLRARFRGDRASPAARTKPAAERVVFPYGSVERARAQLLDELMRPE